VCVCVCVYVCVCGGQDQRLKSDFGFAPRGFSQITELLHEDFCLLPLASKCYLTKHTHTHTHTQNNIQYIYS